MYGLSGLMELVNHGYGEDHHADGNQGFWCQRRWCEHPCWCEAEPDNSSKPLSVMKWSQTT